MLTTAAELKTTTTLSVTYKPEYNEPAKSKWKQMIKL